MIDALGKNGVRSKGCIGEYHNSVFDLQRQQLQLESTTGTTQLIDLTNTTENILSLLLADDLSYVELLYDLTESQFDPLARFSGDRELIFSIGGEEELATITPGGIVRFNDAAHLSQLDDVDLLTIRLYQNNDAANILWEFAFGNGLNVISSSNQGSRDAKSFVMRGTEDPIKVQWLAELKPADTIQWKVEALSGLKSPNVADDLGTLTDADKKKIMYGKIQAQSFLGGNAGGTGTGQFGTPWLSDVRTAGTNAQQVPLKEIWFRPDMSDEPHPAYGVSEDGLSTHKGTKKTDVWRRNPKVGYKVTFILNGTEQASTTIRMDEIDVVRQEYINHLASTQGTSSSLIVEVPEREALVNKNNLGSILAGDWSQSDYTYLAEKHLTLLANIAKSNISGEAAQSLNVLNNVNVSLPVGSTISGIMRINSGWRNPERNERVGGVVTSRHMVGRALDIGSEGVIGYGASTENRSKMMWVMWNALQNAPAIQGNIYIRYLMENGTTGLIQTGSPSASNNKPTSVTMADQVGPGGAPGADGIPDNFNIASHFHVETKPNLSVGD